MPLLTPIDWKEKRYRGNIQNNYEKNLKKSRRRGTPMIKEMWNDAVKTIVGCGKGLLGTKTHGRSYEDDIKELSKEQMKLRLIISSSNCEY